MNYKLKNVRPVAVSGAWNDSGAFSLLESGLNPLRIGERKLKKKNLKIRKKVKRLIFVTGNYSTRSSYISFINSKSRNSRIIM